MNCPNCGKSNLLQAQTCGNCGHSLHTPVFPSILPSAPPETISAAPSSRISSPNPQKPGCLGSLLKRALVMLAAAMVGWLCGLVNAALLPAFAQTEDSAYMTTFILSASQMCLSFIIALIGGIIFNRRRQTV